MRSQLQQYRNDRRKLLDFILSSSSIQTPSSSELNLDTLSVDYVIERVKSGGVVDVSEGSNKYFDESNYPVMIHSRVQSTYYLTSDQNMTESPPRRMPPPPVTVNENQMSYNSTRSPVSSSQLDHLIIEKTVTGEEHHLKCKVTTPSKSEENLNLLSIGLPRLKTGLSDDDLRECAYDILLASTLFSGVEIYSNDSRKKERSSKILSGLMSKRDKNHVQIQLQDRRSEIISIIRVQMQISEAMDACTRRALMPLAARGCGSVDVPQVSLGLLNGIFKSDFSNEKAYIHWKNRQAYILEELLCSSTNLATIEHQSIKGALAKIIRTEEWDMVMSPSERIGVLLGVRQVASKLASLPTKFGIQGETSYWTWAYHLNIRVYEKLLMGLFDILDEGQLIAEADEILLLIRTTWSTLGITQTMHHALYGWVLLQQFVVTGEGMLLDIAVLQLKKVLSAKDDDKQEGQYMTSLACSVKYKGRKTKLSFVQAMFYSISIWCDAKLQDYHLHFGQHPRNFKRVIDLAVEVGHLTSNSSGFEAKPSKVNASSEAVTKKLKTYVRRSIKAAYKRVESTMDLEAKEKNEHPLAVLGEKLRMIVEREFKSFFPVLSQYHTESGIISAMLLHQFYGERLKKFLEEVSCLTEDTKAVLSAAYMLDRALTELYSSAQKDQKVRCSITQDLVHYEIGEVSKPIILDWVISKHVHILECIGRAFDLEDWEPLSPYQRQAASIVEVFRILEEIVDQLFGLNLPLDITHLQALISIIYHSLDSYLIRLLNQLVGKNHLYPVDPPLTRYAESFMPMMRKKLHGSTRLEENVKIKLNDLTVSKLCIRLNTLQYIRKQVVMLENGIRKFWALSNPLAFQKQENGHSFKNHGMEFAPCSDVVDELFETTFNSIKDTTADAICRICDLAGAKFVFCDMRETFLYQLYRGKVEGARLDCILPHIDTVLDHICDLLDDNLRDSVVLSILQSFLEGYVWILLNGGPSRAFDEADVVMMEEDLHLFKEFFIADGEGLPRSLVDKETKSAEMILSLFSLQSESLIQMLMTASEYISAELEARKQGHACVDDAQTLMRVLCHKKDREASNFLKKQYQLPMSSEYDEAIKASTSASPQVLDLLKRSTSVHWTKKGKSNFKSITKKLQVATSEIRQVAR